MTENDNPLIIPPPPRADPPRKDASAEQPDPGADRSDPSAPLITLPPGLVDSATHRLGTRVTKRHDAGSTAGTAPVRRSADEIVFFPSPPGAAVASLPRTAAASSEPIVEAPDDLSDATVIRPTGSVASWRLTLPGGETVQLPTTTFVGRNPSVTPGWPAAALLAVSDPAKSVSKTHALLEITDGRLWAHDLDSTNGVWVIVDGKDDTRVTPGDRVQVPPGANLELGEFVIQVEHSGR